MRERRKIKIKRDRYQVNPQNLIQLFAQNQNSRSTPQEEKKEEERGKREERKKEERKRKKEKDREKKEERKRQIPSESAKFEAVICTKSKLNVDSHVISQLG